MSVKLSLGLALAGKSPTLGGIQTRTLVVMRHMLYHCATTAARDLKVSAALEVVHG